ncbi:MAG: pentapeptide repeat-containing protein [Lysobacter sp.]|nr:pentapeptide repeat-containing protein [Lysobacter sp.]
MSRARRCRARAHDAKRTRLIFASRGRTWASKPGDTDGTNARSNGHRPSLGLGYCPPFSHGGCAMKGLVWVLVGTLGMLAAGTARAADPEAVYRLTHPRSCPACDLSQVELAEGMDLSGYDLSRSRLTGAKLRGANLQSAVLTGVDLNGADLSGSNSRSARWDGAQVRGVDLSRAQWDADFSGFDLSAARFKDVQLSGNRFVGATLRDTDWRGSTLARVDWARSDLRGADFTGVRVQQGSFAGANAGGVKFTGLQGQQRAMNDQIDFGGANLLDADFTGATCGGKGFRLCARSDAATTCPAGNKGPCADYVSADIARNKQTLIDTNQCRGCDLRGTTLDSKGGAGVALDGADLRHASLYRFNAPDGSLNQVKLQGADVVGDYSRAKLEGADLRADRLMGSFVEAQMTGADLSGADIQMSDYRRAVLVNAKLINTLVYGTDLRGANLTGADVSGLRYGHTAKTDATTTCPNGRPGPCGW